MKSDSSGSFRDSARSRSTRLVICRSISAPARQASAAAGCWMAHGVFLKSVNPGEKCDGCINVTLRHIFDGSTIDPAQQCKTAVCVGRDHARHDLESALLHQAQRPYFGRKPIARVIVARRVLFEREAMTIRVDMKYPAIASTTDLLNGIDRAADKSPCNIGDLAAGLVRDVH